MRRSAPSVRSLSASASSSAVESMSVAPRYRGGGRRQWQRNVSDQHDNAGRGQHVASHNAGSGQYAARDSISQPVQAANAVFREGEGGNSQHPSYNGRRSYNQSFGPPLPYNHNQQYTQNESRPPFSRGRPYTHNQSFRFRQTSPPYNSNQQFAPPQQYNQNPRIYRPPPNIRNPQFPQQPLPYLNQPYYRPPPYDRNPAMGPPQQSRPRPPPALNYRNWEFAGTKPPANCKQFVVLSYNVLGDYLALNHRSKLYYHIPQYMLDWDWRKRNIIFELGLWSADIMCFQEVDRFQDLEEELKLRGYCGIWKMRTGDPVDGCAIFWRTTRFKLLHEEFIEFNKLGLRDNVAQICVLELVNEHSSEDAGSTPICSTGSNKIVVCNIHVLYNPKRGEIKLGQIRILLDSAHVVSKSWDNAPVVLCGDFNCTPKSPLYNFISEQKLNISGIDRDKVSGQASAEICETRPNFRNNRELPTDKSIQHRPKVESLEEHKHSSAIIDDIPIKDELAPQQSCSSEQVQDSCNCKEPSREAPKSDIPIAADDYLDEITSSHTSYDQTVETSSSLGGRGLPEDLRTVDIADEKFSEDCCVLAEESTDLRSSAIEPNDTDISISVTTADLSFNEESAAESLDEKLQVLSLDEVDEPSVEGGQIPCEDDATFLAALHEGEESLRLESSSGLELEPVNGERTPYDPSVWTSTEIATATGSEDCLVLEHKLKLKSTYTEVEDVSKTRDNNGEPLVTSYNSRFMGTVDYIWRSEGLQTVRVLAPIPKLAMQWTPGFPTKKWGSDHIALVSELALTGSIVSGEEAQVGETPP